MGESLLDEVRGACREVAEEARQVHFVAGSVERYASSLLEEMLPRPELDPAHRVPDEVGHCRGNRWPHRPQSRCSLACRVPEISVIVPARDSEGSLPALLRSLQAQTLTASQFEVLDHRPIETILGDVLATGATIDCYEPGA